MCDNIFLLIILYINNLFFKSKYEKAITLTILRKINKKSCLKKKSEFSHKNYIFELFKILQCKTGNEFRKSHLFEPLGKFLTFS